MNVRERQISIQVRVARVQGFEAGLAFRVNTELERQDVLFLMAVAMEEGQLLPEEPEKR